MPDVWMHKETGELSLVAINWVPVDDKNVNFPIYINDERIACAYGSFHQEGWLFANKNDVYFVLGMQAKEFFESLGPLCEETK